MYRFYLHFGGGVLTAVVASFLGEKRIKKRRGPWCGVGARCVHRHVTLLCTVCFRQVSGTKQFSATHSTYSQPGGKTPRSETYQPTLPSVVVVAVELCSLLRAAAFFGKDFFFVRFVFL